jgi:pimeloyl-ACP methyl ester carboxylesterase
VAELADLVPGSRLITIEGAGHLPCVEQPDAVAAAMLGFLAENRLG